MTDISAPKTTNSSSSACKELEVRINNHTGGLDALENLVFFLVFHHHNQKSGTKILPPNFKKKNEHSTNSPTLYHNFTRENFLI